MSTDVANTNAGTATGEPVAGFPLQFTWSTGDWQRIFDEQIALVKSDVARAKADDRLVVYLSCPISSRGGGWSGANVAVAKHVERSLLQRWGDGFWILNPAQYQLESKAGVGLLNEHARRLGIDLSALASRGMPLGGDYMRMWTKVLVEDDGRNVGRNFDAYYFVGPSDVHSFFSKDDSTTLTAAVELYFAQKFATDAVFRDVFSAVGAEWGTPAPQAQAVAARADWKKQRAEFLKFYSLKASVNFSLGSHDEWAIFRLLNSRRRDQSRTVAMLDGDVGDQLAGFFDGRQLDPGATEAPLSRGYAR